MSSLNRRDFIKGLSMSAAAAVAAPMTVPGTALGLDGGVSANERVAMGVVGCGSHSRSWNCPLMLQNKEQQIVAICDPDENHLNNVKNYVNGEYTKQTGTSYNVAAFKDFRDVVNRKDVDAIDVITPDHWHVLMSVFAMKAGKHVITEKPVLTIRQGQKLVQTQKETGKILHVASEFRTFDVCQKVVNLCRNKIIGELKNIKVLLPYGNRKRNNMDFNVRPIPPTLDYDLWSGPAPILPFMPGRLHINWRNHFAYAGGTLPDWGAHLTNIAYWAANSDAQPPVKFSVNTDNPKTRYTIPGKTANINDFPPADVCWTTAPQWDINALFANGIKMRIWSDTTIGIKVEGTNGWYLAKWPFDKPEASSPEILNWEPGPNDIDVGRDLQYCMVSRVKGKGLPFAEKGGEHVHFSHCVKTGNVNTYYPAWLGFNTDVTGLTGNIMMVHDLPSLEWDAKAQKYVGENADVANSSFLFDRPQRDPYTFDNIDSWINVG